MLIKVFYDQNKFQSKPEILEMTQLEFEAFVATLPKGEICHIATPLDEIEVEQSEAEKARNEYIKAIAEKYDQPLSWPSNRWFVEQVRPSLF